jgi:hypothetical protein
MGSLQLSPSSQKLRVILTNISIGSPLYFKFFLPQVPNSIVLSTTCLYPPLVYRGMAQPAAATCYIQLTLPTAPPTTPPPPSTIS